MTLPTILVLGSVNTDLVVRSPRLPRPGETVLGGRFAQFPGGKGANQAVAAVRAADPLLMSVTLVAALGDDALGQELLAFLRQEQIDTRYLKIVPRCASGVAMIVVDQQGENAICVAPGANAALRPEDIDALPEALFAQACVFLACLETPLESVIRGLQRAKAHGVPTILNPAPADLAASDPQVLRLVDVLTPNELEARALAGSSSSAAESTSSEWVALARQLLAAGCGAVVLTRGAEGCLVTVPRALPIQILGHRVGAVDTTAAGDAFNGVLAVGLAEGQPLAQAAALANCAGALAVTRPGAGPSLPTRGQIHAFLRQNT
jgi:ribokinase